MQCELKLLRHEIPIILKDSGFKKYCIKTCFFILIAILIGIGIGIWCSMMYFGENPVKSILAYGIVIGIALIYIEIVVWYYLLHKICVTKPWQISQR